MSWMKRTGLMIPDSVHKSCSMAGLKLERMQDFYVGLEPHHGGLPSRKLR